MNKNLIIIFTRNPELGKVKKRLAATIGDNSALNIYKLLINHTEKTVRKIEVNKIVYYSEQVIENDIWNNSTYQKHLQHGENLGERMQNAFVDAFSKGYKKVAIIGTDLYDLNAEGINKAFKQLNNHEVIIGPAEDGGYYLIGMNKPHPFIFENKPWSDSKLLETTLNELKSKNIEVSLLKTLNDIDTFEDLKQYPELLKLIS